jgi:hypothetical protein
MDKVSELVIVVVNICARLSALARAPRTVFSAVAEIERRLARQKRLAG